MSVIIEKNQRLRADIIKFLYYKAELSLTDLSKLTKKSLPLVTATVGVLIDEGQVLEKGLAPSTGGRRPAVFLINPAYKKYVVSVAMDQLITRLEITDLSGRVMLPIETLDLAISNDASGAQKLAQFINTAIEKAHVKKENILGVGIGMPGFVSVEEGINHSFLVNEGGPVLKDYLSKEIGLPVYMDNDSSLIALAEFNFGEAVDTKDTLVVNIGWGTGLGMIINGQLYRGSSGYAGEFSHIPLSTSNNLCSCGKRGCIEVDTSLLVLAERAQKAVREGAESSLQELFKDTSKHPGDHFLEAASKQDPLAISILSTAGFQLGKGLATLIHILNPKVIVLSGRGAKAGKMFLPSIQQAINEFCIPRISDQTTLKISRIYDTAELKAAAALVVENTLF
ncbi:ROK family protein [Pedobacter sp. MW01-1-1]|uniref:ROK family protein n=1 Tax=Pedobacter sp. MW01-1-1 TaxID=3383027 RepID=UPI003FF14804